MATDFVQIWGKITYPPALISLSLDALIAPLIALDRQAGVLIGTSPF